LDIQDSLQVGGILLYVAGRSEEIKTLVESAFTPSDWRSFAMALQKVGFFPAEGYKTIIRGASLHSFQHLRENNCSPEEGHKIKDALWKLTQWTKMPPPIARCESF
jgi:hypothetical protein